MNDVGIGIVGAGFVAALHAEAIAQVPSARLAAVAASSKESARRFADHHGVPSAYGDWRRLVDDPDVHLVDVALPNHLHREVVVAAAAAGKHVVVEKPFARTLAEADEMLDACRRAGVLCLYAEELCFAPKYVRAKELADSGALGRVYLVRQGEQHDGPHSDWFWDVERSGGGVLLDMGCHGVEFCRWVFGKPAAVSVTATLGRLKHAGRTRGDDHAILGISFEGDRIGLVDTSWCKPGGMDDRGEIVGSAGITYADLLRGSSLHTFSGVGYGYAVEKAESTVGWSFTMFEELWNYGFPQEFRHFVDCVQHGTPPLETGADGRAVLEILYAAYLAAGPAGRATLPLTLDAAAAADIPARPWLGT